MTYSEQLNTPEWQSKRLEIFERDNHECQKCFNKGSLHVHHKQYSKNRMSWEYEDKHLITLCKDCHEYIHHIKSIKKYQYKKAVKEYYNRTELDWCNIGCLWKSYKKSKDTLGSCILAAKKEEGEFIQLNKNKWLETNPIYIDE